MNLPTKGTTPPTNLFFFCLLITALLMPSSSYALRGQQPLQSGTEEAIRTALRQASSAAGMEERRGPAVSQRWLPIAAGLLGVRAAGSGSLQMAIFRDQVIEALQSRLPAGNAPSLRQIVDALYGLVEESDREFTAEHVSRTTRYAQGMIRQLDRIGLPGPEQPLDTEVILAGVLLHDIGKLGIPASILHKAGPLTPSERFKSTRCTVI